MKNIGDISIAPPQAGCRAFSSRQGRRQGQPQARRDRLPPLGAFRDNGADAHIRDSEYKSAVVRNST
jgi:hypothetical protein